MAILANYTNLFIFLRFAVCFSKYSDNKVKIFRETRTDFTAAIDITKYLNAFSNRKVMVLIDNYKRVDIKRLKYPSLTRKYIKAYWISSQGYKKAIRVNPTALKLNHTRILSSVLQNTKKMHCF